MIWVWTVWGEYGAIHTTERVIERKNDRYFCNALWTIFGSYLWSGLALV